MKDVTPRKIGREERDQGRTVMAMKLLWELLDAAQKQIDPIQWLFAGGLDAEELLECIESGRGHHALRRWQGLKGGGRPGPTRRDLRVRRLIVMAVIALQRVVSTDGDAARGIVAAAASKLLTVAPTAEGIHYWQRGQDPTTPAEEQLLALVIANSQDPGEVVGRFLDLAHTIETPAPFHMCEKGGGLLAREGTPSLRDASETTHPTD